jgi:alkylated DNA repair dioxygenase AlkB
MSFKVGSCDLLIMGGASQRYYAHEIPSCEQEVGVRYSCVLREHKSVEDWSL